MKFKSKFIVFVQKKVLIVHERGNVSLKMYNVI